MHCPGRSGHLSGSFLNVTWVFQDFFNTDFYTHCLVFFAKHLNLVNPEPRELCSSGIVSENALQSRKKKLYPKNANDRPPETYFRINSFQYWLLAKQCFSYSSYVWNT